MRVLIIEDENRAANRIERLLQEIKPQITLLGKLESIKEAISFLATETPDLIISDIQLADGLSFEIFETIKEPSPIIFTTAYDQYAIDAFETNGIDYLLKPIEKERLQKALEKFEQFAPRIPVDQLLKLNKVAQKSRYKSRFMIKVGDKIKSIPIADIAGFHSLEKGTYLRTYEGRNYVLELSLEQVKEALDPNTFFKVNRKFIICIEAINEIIAHTNSRLKLKVNAFEEDEIIVAREKVKDFKFWLDQ